MFLTVMDVLSSSALNLVALRPLGRRLSSFLELVLAKFPKDNSISKLTGQDRGAYEQCKDLSSLQPGLGHWPSVVWPLQCA